MFVKDPQAHGELVRKWFEECRELVEKHIDASEGGDFPRFVSPGGEIELQLDPVAHFAAYQTRKKRSGGPVEGLIRIASILMEESSTSERRKWNETKRSLKASGK